MEPGVEMKRSSHIFTHAAKPEGKITDVRVGGHVVELLHGGYSL
jgi:predicted PhzF superfamily epimerase YddE/YHI9